VRSVEVGRAMRCSRWVSTCRLGLGCTPRGFAAWQLCRLLISSSLLKTCRTEDFRKLFASNAGFLRAPLPFLFLPPSLPLFSPSLAAKSRCRGPKSRRKAAYHGHRSRRVHRFKFAEVAFDRSTQEPSTHGSARRFAANCSREARCAPSAR